MLENPSNANNLSSSYGQDVQAEISNAPALLAANQTYSPAYTQLAMQNFNSAMTGPNGYLSLYQNQIAPAAAAAQAASNTAVRTGTVGDINALVPGMVAATRSANPTAAGMLDTITGQTNNNLNYGTTLSPTQTTQLDESVRAGQAARGLGTGAGDATQEALAQTNYGQQLYQQRLANASQAAAKSTNFYSGVLPSIGGAQANMAIGSGLSGMGGGLAAPASMGEFTPNSSLISDNMNNNYSASDQGAANNNAMIIGGISAAEGAGKGMASAMGGSGGGGSGGMSY